MQAIVDSTDVRLGIFFADRKSIIHNLLHSKLIVSSALAGILYISTAQALAATPLPPNSATVVASPSVNAPAAAYYYQGRSYPYRYHGMYYRHRYYRYGRWHYY